ncbi:protein of unknown function [Nonomuraea solani]|uniref:DUF1707 domain-containing protein n=2 Tax=Nonomuraea solani TaxID=1144553 RepID=A0A1H6BM27_9ACTN|nr:protein of unknown function [Nonomuraea solani]
MSDADRERITARLRSAHGDGRLTFEEFEQRLSGVLGARTFGEADPYVADLPGGPVAAPVHDRLDLRASASTLKRRGPWVVPRLLRVTNRPGPVKLDFTDAVIPHRVVEIELDVTAGSTTLILPPTASVTIDDVELIASPARVKDLPATPGPGVHFVVRGRQRFGRLLVRTQRRLWRLRR